MTFEHGRTRRFGFVIGADGLHSKVRGLAFGKEDVLEKYLGYMAAAFEVERYRPRDENVYVSYSLPGRQVARFAMPQEMGMSKHPGRHSHPGHADQESDQATARNHPGCG